MLQQNQMMNPQFMNINPIHMRQPIQNYLINFNDTIINAIFENSHERIII